MFTLVVILGIGVPFFVFYGSLKKLTDLEQATRSYQSPRQILNGEPHDENLVSGLPNAAQEESFSASVRSFSKALATGQFENALTLLNDTYHYADQTQIDQLMDTLFLHAQKLIDTENYDDATRLLNLFLESFDHVNALQILAVAYVRTEQWEQAINSLLQANQLQADSVQYNTNLEKLSAYASQLSKQLLNRGDEQASLQLYQRLYSQYPQHSEFALGLAKHFLLLGSAEQALPLLETLQYDPEYSAIATQLAGSVADEQEQQNIRTREQEQIAIPLIRRGTSFLVDAQINGNSTRLLLDTGASITALATGKIVQLKLKPTGRSITLSTANGIRRARTYFANRITLGEVKLVNSVVAEIELPNQTQIDGLLGTDVLRQISGDFGYIIDDQQSAILIRERK